MSNGQEPSYAGRRIFGAILLILLAAAGMAGWKYGVPQYNKWKIEKAANAGRQPATRIRIGGDNYLGYWFVQSPEMQKALARDHILVDWTDDGGAYADRLKKFADSEYDAIVLPVASYLQHGEKHKYPGKILAAISESKGADGIVILPDPAHPISKINDLNDPTLRVVYTPESPSSFLLDLTIADFSLDKLRADKGWQVEENGGSNAVLKRLKKGDGDVFVMWEPDITKALHDNPNAKYLWGSDKFSGYIVDVFVFRADFVKDKKDAVATFFKNYFRTLSIYQNDRERLKTEMAKTTDLPESVIEKMTGEIEWYDVTENACEEFGLRVDACKNPRDRLYNTIIDCTRVLKDSGKFSRDPLGGDIDRIIDANFLSDLAQSATAQVASGPKNVTFNPLSDDEWKKLKEVGSARVDPITFQRGSGLLTDEGKEAVNSVATLLTNNYPAYRVVVRGHTGPGDEEENIRLSRERADAVVQYMTAVYSIDANRLHAEGIGSKQPLQKLDNENPRAYQARLARVEFMLIEPKGL